MKKDCQKLVGKTHNEGVRIETHSATKVKKISVFLLKVKNWFSLFEEASKSAKGRVLRKGCSKRTSFRSREEQGPGPRAWGRRSSADPEHWATWGPEVDPEFLRNIVDPFSGPPGCRWRGPWGNWLFDFEVVPPSLVLLDRDVLKQIINKKIVKFKFGLFYKQAFYNLTSYQASSSNRGVNPLEQFRK